MAQRGASSFPTSPLETQARRLGGVPLERHATHLSPVDVVEDEVELAGRLEGVMKAHQERMFDVLQQHVPFRHDVLLLSGKT